jgi:DNA-binding GntR family transcriptional regulator
MPEIPRYRARARKLTPDQETSIRAFGTTKSLRALAAEFGVSHETVRAVLNSAAHMKGL